MTGVTAAHYLKNRAEVHLFEKSRGLGGRMATRRAANTSFDHGAQYFVAKSAEFKDFLRAPLANGAISLWRARFHEIDGRTGATLGGRTWDDTYPHYVGIPSMNALVKYLAKNMLVQRHTRVDRLQQIDNEQWLLWSDQGERLGQYDWVLLTCPPEQTVALLPDACNFKTAVSKIELLPCYSVMLAFNQDLNLRFDAALVRHADISWIAQNHSKPHRGSGCAMVIQSNNDWAKSHLEHDLDTVKHHLISEASRILDIDLSQAIHNDIHRWRYANTVVQRAHQGDVYFDQEHQLGAAGDWCGNARVESAYLHGRQLAEKLLKTL